MELEIDFFELQYEWYWSPLDPFGLPDIEVLRGPFDTRDDARANARYWIELSRRDH